ncbi:PTS transporter subunit EIIC [Clostridium intestinale]|uniref:PTS system, beta-glucosides-specific IIC component n=1 Tax=Clostridium intestinale DSM 6191 TaxID=1121320 RepID=A0A1M5WNJ7_9CLOT|nr:PTS transporter subunit EIIC [Clostridium intestinale]SHH88724.1 PTS system, beta-glucosides-specific IIC component [Clostridium intestinale DSM 6191]
MNYELLAKEIIKKIGGNENVNNVAHCATRLRFNLRDKEIVDAEEVKKIEGVMGVVDKGGQFQLIIGPQVSSLYDEVIKLVTHKDVVEVKKEKIQEKKSFKNIINTVFDYLAGSLTPLIPILLAASLCKTIAAIIGPSLLGVVSDTSDIYTLFTFVGDAGFYFLPVFVGYTAAKKFECNQAIGMLLGGILIHPTFINMAQNKVSFSVYGIPTIIQGYSSTIIPMMLIVWVMSYVEKFFKKYSPDVLKVFLIPFGTLIVMLPLALSVLGPLGGFLGTYVCEGILAINRVAGPLGVAIIGGTFAILVLTGMHPLLFTYLFVTFPTIGYDNFLLPGILCASWAGTGVAIACIFKFKNREKKSLTFGYITTWFLGGVGEPLLYGISVTYKTPLYAGAIAGFGAGLVAGLLKLTAYVLNTSNGVYGLAAFVGGSTSNYVALVITVAASLIIGFVVMLFMKLDENIN